MDVGERNETALVQYNIMRRTYFKLLFRPGSSSETSLERQKTDSVLNLEIGSGSLIRSALLPRRGFPDLRQIPFQRCERLVRKPLLAKHFCSMPAPAM